MFICVMYFCTFFDCFFLFIFETILFSFTSATQSASQRKRNVLCSITNTHEKKNSNITTYVRERGNEMHSVARRPATWITNSQSVHVNTWILVLSSNAHQMWNILCFTIHTNFSLCFYFTFNRLLNELYCCLCTSERARSIKHTS